MIDEMLVRRNLLSIEDLGREGILEILRESETFVEVASRRMPKVPALRGKTIAIAFFEKSTRTRLSFEMAAKRLSADTLTIDISASSMSKGESLRDTLETIDALGVDAIVMRHQSSGAAVLASKWVQASVVNAGDGQHEHPTQALLDAFTLREAIRRFQAASVEDLSSCRVTIVGDVRHSRVARSNVLALSALGARITLVAPRELLPVSVEDWPIEAVTEEIDSVLPGTDACYVLRIQHERMVDAGLSDLGEYRRNFGLTIERAQRLAPHALIMHPGPLNRGVEIDSQVADGPNSLIRAQVRNGVPVRMAVLFHLLGTSRNAVEEIDDGRG
ncbi:MAG TPA: aspartate carbamoyltransferase catalytic subunit [Acidimicrobiales bacterium]|nr:aspartate carbamoyltransferase catalytic subunit [Acidimicrobiales bacterium]